MRARGYGNSLSRASRIRFLSLEFPLFPNTAVKKAITWTVSTVSLEHLIQACFPSPYHLQVLHLFLVSIVYTCTPLLLPGNVEAIERLKQVLLHLRRGEGLPLVREGQCR